MANRITPETLAKSGTELGHQSALFLWALEYEKIFPQIKYMFAIPNGGLRDRITAARLKQSGVKSGVPDIMLPVACEPFHGLFIEMKKPGKKIKEGSNQDDYAEFLCRAGYRVVACDHWEQARQEIIYYIWRKLP